MGILVNQNQIGGGGTSNTPHNIGDIFYTTRTDNSLNGAVECNGSQYNFSDFDSNLQSLFDEGKLPYLPISEFDSMVTNQGGCDSFGYGTNTIWSKWSAGLGYVYTNKKPVGAAVGDPVYDAPGGNIIGNITYVNKDGFWTLSYDDGAGSGGPGIFDDYVNGPIDSTPYFKVPKKLGRVLVRSQKPTADNNYTWYNVYADGWVEQGGTVVVVNGNVAANAYNTKSITFPIAMQTTKCWNCQAKHDRFNAGFANTDGVTTGANVYQVNDSSMTSFNNPFVIWEVKGYATPSEYTKDKWNYQNVQVERPMVQLFNSTTDTAVATCNQVLADVSALNQGDYVIETQLPTEENNYSWYRLYKSGWVEQGKFRNLMGSNGNTTCMLIIPMKDTNYFITGVYDTNTNAVNSLARLGVGTKTTQSFQMYTEGGSYSWEVKGFSNITN